MAIGIPAYRLPRAELNRDIDAICELGVELRLNTAIGRDVTLDELQVRSGDQLVVPSNRHGDLFEPVRFIAVLLSIPVTIYTLTKIIK